MHLFLGLAIAFIAASRFGISGFILGALVGVLAAEVLVLRKRVNLLEKLAEAEPAAEKIVEQEVVFRPAAAGPADPNQKFQPKTVKLPPLVSSGRESAGKASVGPVSFPDRLRADLLGNAKKISSRISQFFTSGNLVLKIGIVIIFFGVAFLLKYAAQRNMVPLELRLIGVALGGLAALGIGWWLRRTKAGYGLVLQGGGVGILYLVIFAAARLYSFVPMTLALALMIGLVALSGMLAVLDRKSVV